MFYGNIETKNSTRCNENEKYKNIWKNLNEDEKFKMWLVGFTDGDGCFSIVKSGATFRLQYTITQSTYNIRILYKIKSKLGFGSVVKYSKDKGGAFRITDRKVLNNVIFPIFDKYPLNTSKYFSYKKFKKAYDILENSNLTTEQKNKAIEEIRSSELPDNYISPAIAHLSEESQYKDIAKVVTVYWLAGFIEAEGCFGIYAYPNRISIDFTISQKLDKNLLILIKGILHFPSNVNYNKSQNMYVLYSSNSRVMTDMVDIFRGKFYGMKSLEFKLWSVANYYKKVSPEKVRKLSNILKRLGRRNYSNKD